jgi:hypothetical protein
MRCGGFFWLGFWFWWEHPGAELGRFFASLAVVGTWGDQPPSGVVGRGQRVTRRCPRRCGADLCPWSGRGGRFFQGGVLRDRWLDRAGAACPSWARKNYDTLTGQYQPNASTASGAQKAPEVKDNEAFGQQTIQASGKLPRKRQQLGIAPPDSRF